MATALSVCKAMAWDAFVQSPKSGFSYAIKTSQGISFAITEDFCLVFMADDSSCFSAQELKICFKADGATSDYAESRVVCQVLTDTLEKPSEAVLHQAIMDVPEKFRSLAIKDFLFSKDWGAIADELTPYLLAFQDTVTYKDVHQ